MNEKIGKGRMINEILNHSANASRDASEQHALALAVQNWKETELRAELKRLEIDPDRPTPT